MADSINRKLEDRAIRHATALVRVRNGTARDIGRLLDDALREVSEELERRVSNINAPGTFQPSRQRRRRLRQMRESLREGIRGVQLRDTLVQNLEGLALTERDSQLSILNSVTPGELGIAYRKPSASLLRSIVTSRPFEGQILSEWTRGIERSTVNRVAREVNLGLTAGESNQDITRRVRRQLNTTRQEAQAVARTAVNHVSAQAREVTFGENDDIVKGVKWVSTLDRRTSIICASLDGRVFPVNEGRRPPAHFNCRSTTTPVLRSWRELGFDADELSPSTRASMDGQVPETQDFPQWLKRQPRDVQESVLGPTRARAFRGGTNISEFVDDNLRPLTVSELRRLERLG